MHVPSVTAVFTVVQLEAEASVNNSWGSLASISLTLKKQTDNTYAIRPRVLGFYEERGGDSPRRSRPVQNSVLICILKLLSVSKITLYR